MTRYWDNDHTIGKWFADHNLGNGPVLYDAYLLHGPNTTWDDATRSDKFDHPILGDTTKLQKGVTALAVWTRRPSTASRL